MRDTLSRGGVETRTNFDPPRTGKRAYQDLGLHIQPLPVTERVASEILDLPIYPE